MTDLSVGIRSWQAGDLPLLERLLGDPALTTHLGGPETADAIARRHERYLASDGSTDGLFAIVVGPDREAVGWAGYWATAWNGEDVWEIGWHLLAEWQGRGVATRAVASVIDRAYIRGTRRYLHAFPDVANTASNALCTRLGFTSRGEVDIEYPPGRPMRAVDRRLDLALPRAVTLSRRERCYTAAGPARLPVIAAHRGVSGDESENELAALAASVVRGVEAVEIDVRQTADGVLVLHHDATERGTALARTTFAELRELIPGLCRLDDALDAIAPHLFVDVEVKAAGYEDAVVALLCERCVPGRYVLTSFDDGVVRRLKALAPDVPVGLLLGRRRPQPWRVRLSELFPGRRLARCGADFVAPNERLLKAALLRRMDRGGYPVCVWTVNAPHSLARLAARREVAAIVTDRALAAMPLRDEPPAEALGWSTRAGLWYIFAATPRSWRRLARAFALTIRPVAPDAEALSRAEDGATEAVRFVPVPLATGALSAWLFFASRPWVNGLLREAADGLFLGTARAAFRLGVDHLLAESIGIAVAVFGVWLASLASILALFAPVWLVFRRQVRLAEPVIALGLALGEDPATARDHPALLGHPRVRYAMGHLFGPRMLPRRRTRADGGPADGA